MDLSLEQICFGGCNFSFFEQEGDFFFRANDLAKYLAYDRTNDMLQIVRDETPETVLTRLRLFSSGQNREFVFLTESQMYIIDYLDFSI